MSKAKRTAKAKAAKPARKPSLPKAAGKAKPRTVLATGRGQTIWPREVIIGKRHRKNMGDLPGLARSIDDRGALLQPIVIDAQHNLIGGQRRLAAWPLTKFRKEPIPCHIVDVDSIVAGEWDENAQRKDFEPEEAVALKRELEPEIRRRLEAKEAERPTGSKPAPGRKGKLEDRIGRANDILARHLGKGRRTLEKAEKIVQAAEDNPKFRPLVDQMNATGKVNASYKKLQVATQVAAIATNKANGTLSLPEGQFDRMVADIPWPYELDDENPAENRAVRGYPTISITEALAMGPAIAARMAANVVMYFWTTNFHMEVAYKILRAWGFTEFPTILTWGKDRFGKGQRFRCATEHAIVAIKGAPCWNLTNETTLLKGPVREDSRKPDEFYALIDVVSPAERSLELFARRVMPAGWLGYGDQVGKLKDAPAADVADSFPGPFVPLEDGDYTDLGALEAVATRNETLVLLPTSWLDKLIANKWILGRKAPRLSKLGYAEMERLRALEIASPTEPRQIELEELIAAQGAIVDCRVCSTGDGLCVACLPASEHVISHTNPNGLAVASCSCGWETECDWNDKLAMAAQEVKIKAHWQRVVSEKQAAE